MKGEFHNLRRQIGLKSAWLFVPALGAILSGAGVVANRAVDLTQLTDAVVRAESRAARCTELERRLAAEIAQGRLRLADAAAAARKLFGMAIGAAHMALLLGIREAPARSEVAQMVADAVAIFLHGTLVPERT